MDEAGTYPLSWGQAWPWLDQFRFGWRRTFDPIGFRIELPEPGVELATVAGALKLLCQRHETLRSRYFVAAGGEPVQRIGEPALEYEVVRLPEDCGAAAKDQRVAEVIAGERAPFDLTRSCARGLLVARGDRVLDVLVLLDHVAADVWGGEVIRRDLAALLGLTAAATRSHAGEMGQPRDLAVEQSTEAGARRNRAGLAHWREQLTTIPHTLFPEIAQGRDTGIHTVYVARMRSPAAALALDALVERYRISPPAVLFAGFAAVLSRFTGFPRIGMSTAVNNRFSVRRRNTATSAVLPSLASVEVDWSGTVGSLLRRAADALLSANHRSECDHTEALLETIRVQHRRGTSSDLIPQFNCILREQPLGAPAPAREPAATRLVESEEPWQNWIRLGALYGSDLEEVTLHMPSRTAGRAAVSGLLRQLEALLVEQAGTPRELALATVAAFAGVTPPPLRAGWAWVDGCRVRPATVRELVEGHPDVVRCATRVVDEAGVTAIHADVLARTPDLDAVRLHRWLLARLDPHPSAIAPRRYTVTTDPAAFGGHGVPDDGRGAPAHPRAPGTEAERALLDAVRAYAAPGALLEDPFALTGGRLDRVPAVLRRLTAAGWEGLDLEDFLNLRPLQELATALRRASPVEG